MDVTSRCRFWVVDDYVNTIDPGNHSQFWLKQIGFQDIGDDAGQRLGPPSRGHCADKSGYGPGSSRTGNGGDEPAMRLLKGKSAPDSRPVEDALHHG